VQFYLNGFRPGDPTIAPAAVEPGEEGLPDEVDVLIVGAGPTGLVLAAQLSQFAGISTRIIERKPGPIELGQADGVACRSVEMFEAFGLAAEILQEACWVNETVFWSPDPADRSRIARSGRIQDVADDLSEFPHVIVNQARIHQYLADVMRKSPRRLETDYGIEVVSLEVGDGEHPVAVTIRPTGSSSADEERVVRARYVVGCDGARSTVRAAIGRELRGDSANQAWGVIDILPDTDFPDIRFKNTIQSLNGGNIVIIPREGGYLVRLYVELDQLAPDERVAAKDMTAETIMAAAQRIMQPYRIEAKEVVWWSVYEIGQRLTDKFDDVPEAELDSRTPRVFIAGDACHTHSPKAGQGMNVSMQDAFNLGWKLAAVLEGRSDEGLLHTYSSERQSVAKALIDFDRDWAEMFSAPPKDPDDLEAIGVTPADFQARFEASGRYTAGLATHYGPSLLTGDGAHQGLAAGLPIGERFHSAPVLRIADGKLVELGHAARADGRWRLYAFGDASDVRDPGSRLARLCEHLLESPDSPVRRHTRAEADIDSVFDLRGIVQQHFHEVGYPELPELLRPAKGSLGLTDYEKGFSSAVRSGADIYDRRGIDRRAGALVVVRPDQYVANVLPLDAFDELERYFAAILRDVHAGALVDGGAALAR